MTFVVELLLLIVMAIMALVITIKWQHKYWQRKGLPMLKPKFPFGNFDNPFTRSTHIGLLVHNMYKKVREMEVKHAGVYLFTSPTYLPVDLNIVKNILTTDFRHFHDRGFYHNEKDDPLSANLFAISGTKWRTLRIKLTPTFTSGKMKIMFEMMVQCADNMHSAFCKLDSGTEGIEFKEMLARYTTDVIGTCAFGLECNSFANDNAEFRKYGKDIFKPISKWKSFMDTFAFAKPDLARRLGIKLVSEDASGFIMNVVKDTIQYRQAKGIKRNDMLQLLMDLDGSENQLSIDEIAAQVFVFFVAGFDTSSSTMTFCLYELALNSEIQTNLRNEINCVLNKYNGKITYSAILDMPYLQQVIDETLRKYPPLPNLTRMCVEDYNIPDTNIIIEKGTRVYISTLGFHYDPEYFPEPDKFDPERFSEKNRSNIQPFSYLPFGEGPRMCIGVRFGLMQVKIGLITLLRNFRISFNQKTVIPFRIDRYNFVLSPKDGLWLNIEKL